MLVVLLVAIAALWFVLDSAGVFSSITDATSTITDDSNGSTAAWFVGEVIHGDYPAFVAESTVDAVTQYELWKAIWSSLNSANFFELDWALQRHNEFLDTFAPLTFVGNHDVTRIASQLEDVENLPLALAILLTVGGTPSIYYGDEQAFRGVKEDRAGGDDAIRPAFGDKPADLEPYGWPTYRLHQDLIGLRRRHAWLHRARTTKIRLTNEQYEYEVSDGTNRLRVTLDVTAHSYSIEDAPFAHGRLVDQYHIFRPPIGRPTEPRIQKTTPTMSRMMPIV